MGRVDDNTSKCFAETYTGLLIDLINPRPEQINILDIAHALSNQCRFNGHCSEFYSIAQHSVLVSKRLLDLGHGDECQLAGLLHDAAEAYIGDIITPVKSRLPDFKAIEDGLLPTILEHLGGGSDSGKWRAIVKEADWALLATEAKKLMASGGKDWNLPHGPVVGLLTGCWEPWRAKGEFLDTYTSIISGRQ